MTYNLRSRQQSPDMANVILPCAFEGCGFTTGDMPCAAAVALFDNHNAAFHTRPSQPPPSAAVPVDDEKKRLHRVRLPDFDELDPEAWFRIVVNHFQTHSINDPANKRVAVEIALKPAQQRAVAAKLAATATSANPYDAIRDALISVFQRPECEAAAAIIDRRSFGGKDIRELGREWQLEAGRRSADFLMKEQWLRCCGPARAFLNATAPNLSFEELVEATAPHFDSYGNPRNDTPAVAAATAAYTASDFADSRSDADDPAIAAFRKWKPFSKEDDGLCRNHRKFGDKTRKCGGPPCKMAGHASSTPKPASFEQRRRGNGAAGDKW